MRLVAVSRVKNEADIIEAFVRHTAKFVDHHLVLDNGSDDATVRILERLNDEGVQLSLYRNNAWLFAEELFNTCLYREAVVAHGAQWVLFLDADEFIGWHGTPAEFRSWIAAQPDDVLVLEVGLANYVPRSSDPETELNVVLRIKYRMEPMPWVGKVFVRAEEQPDRIDALRVLAGNHGVTRGDDDVPTKRVEDIRLAHYQHRSGAQLALKSILGRVRVLSTSLAPEWQTLSSHYIEPLEKFLADPRGFLGGTAHADHVPAVHDPLAYAGEPLAFTEPIDPLARLLAQVTRAAIHGATATGRHLDLAPELRDYLFREAAQTIRIF